MTELGGHPTIAAADGRAPLEAVDPALQARAILCLFRDGLDTQTIAALLGLDEGHVANVMARLRAQAGAAFLDGRGRLLERTGDRSPQ